MNKQIQVKNKKNKLIKLREKLNLIDDEIILLLKKRFESVKKIGELKKINNLDVYDPLRETQILNRLQKLSKTKKIPLSIQNIKDIFLEIFSISRSLEAKQKIAYLGPSGTFCEQMAFDKFGNSCEYVALSNIDLAFKQVRQNKANYALIPIENNLSGMVSDTLYALNTYNVFIIACDEMIISHSLCTNAKNLSEIKKIYSKDIAFLQCSDFLKAHSSLDAQMIHTNSTAKALEFAMKNNSCAAICSKIIAKRNNINVMYENIQDNNNNITKFITIANKLISNKNSKSVAMLIKIKDKRGALVKFLRSFSKAKINLEKLESNTISGELTFYMQAQTNIYNKKFKKIIKNESNKNKNKIKIIGSW